VKGGAVRRYRKIDGNRMLDHPRELPKTRASPGKLKREKENAARSGKIPDSKKRALGGGG